MLGLKCFEFGDIAVDRLIDASVQFFRADAPLFHDGPVAWFRASPMLYGNGCVARR
jgi:hypothetical protein